MEARVAAWLATDPRVAAIIPKPRPILHGGWEATDWTDCPLAHAYGVPGEQTERCNKRGSRVYD